MKTVNLGLIGAGRIGSLHAENLVHEALEAELLWIADVLEKSARETAERLGIPNWTTDYREVLSDPMVDAVLICTSTDTHAEIIQAAAAAQKHIFCEKPLALDLSEIEKALHAVEKAGVILQVGFHRRFDPHFRRLKELL
ncbi:MAG: Gfo/Idh/MocA family oxidoreductase, partial [Candidatus Bipolaricaulaceae bacterium]